MSSNEPIAKSKPGWKRSLIHAIAMAGTCIAIYLFERAMANAGLPGSVRALTVLAAQGLGYFLICLVLPWAIVFFSIRVAWVVWAMTVGIFTWLLISPHL